MKIETMMRVICYRLYTAGRLYNINFDSCNNHIKRSYRIETGIMRRYIRLQQENARLRDEVAFWKAEALKDGGDA